MVELAPGQDVALEDADGSPLTRVTVGLGWEKEPGRGFIGSGAPDVDLDVSAIEFTGSRYFDFAFFNNLATRDGAVVHQGDEKTGAAAGDDETIAVDLARVHPPVDTILVLVTSYQGHSLDWVLGAYVRVLAGKREVARFTLTGETRGTGAVMVRLSRTAEGWTMRAIGAGITARGPVEAVDSLGPYL